MTSSGKVRIYELSKDLGLENKDVLDAAEKLAIAAKSHSSCIRDDEASRIRSLIKGGSNGAATARPIMPRTPAMNEPMAAIPNAAPPRPWRAS
jgi:translation initiation factor IF-2